MENERVFEFLAGLNCELDDVRSRVLSRRPLPSIREVFSDVRREESRRKVMLWEHLTSGSEASTLVTRGPHAGSGPCNLQIKIADGTLSLVAGKWSIRISEFIALDPFLHDLSSGKMIGSAKEREGLYYFDEANMRGQCPPIGESVSEARPPLTLDYLDVAVFESTLSLISTPSPNIEGHLNSGGDTKIQTNRETLVYSRRPKSKSNETLTSKALKESEPCRAFTTNLDRIQIPKNIQEALEIPEWREAVMEEIRALEKNGTWEVMTLPRGKKPVGCKWVFIVKYKADGTVERYKARLFDIKNAFLNGELEEEVFMTLPPGFCKEEEETRVCKLKKSLYGLKQSLRAWFDRFAKVIKNQGYQQGQSDHTMFFKQSNDGRMTILIMYVDDIILTGENTGEVERLKKVLATEFEYMHSPKESHLEAWFKNRRSDTRYILYLDSALNQLDSDDLTNIPNNPPSEFGSREELCAVKERGFDCTTSGTNVVSVHGGGQDRRRERWPWRFHSLQFALSAFSGAVEGKIGEDRS
ncbi:hypothetical protein AAG906_020228 [Vitis piasezkii]